jgi:hypothetical protein
LEALLLWLEGSALGQLMRASGVWTYGVVNLLHILGIATLFGAVLVLDLRLLGAWRSVPLASLERPALTLAIAGFVLAAASGSALLTTNATEYLGNPFLLLKFAAIGLGLLNVVVAQSLPAWRARHAAAGPPASDTILAAVGGTSLACWLIAVASGRMIGYW